jgi:hypothetical protein
MSEDFEYANFFRRNSRIFLLALCMAFLTVTPAWCDQPNMLEPTSPSSMLTLFKMTGPLDFCGEFVPLDNPEVRERLEKEFLESSPGHPLDEALRTLHALYRRNAETE